MRVSRDGGGAAGGATSCSQQPECNRPPERRQGRGWIPACAVVLLGAVHWVPVAAGAATTGARYLRDAERPFASGVSAFAADDLSRAREEFQSVTDLPANQRTGAALLMLARVHGRLGVRGGGAEEYRAAIEIARTLERVAPGSRYGPDIQLVSGDCYYALKRYYEAATEYARILDGDGSVLVKASAAERLAGIVGNRSITPAALDRIRLQLGAARLRDALVFGQARWYGRLGWAPQSRERRQAYVDSVGSAGQFYVLVQEQGQEATGQPVARPDLSAVGAADAESGAAWKETDAGVVTWIPSSARPGVPRLGVLVPLTGEERATGRDLLSGVRFANEEMGSPFDIVPVDTGAEYVDSSGAPVPVVESEGSRMVRVVAGARFLVEEAGVVAIVGPVFSTSCVAAAVVAEAAGVPLVAPLSQQSGLDEIGRNIFQLNSIPEIQGHALAEYATLVLGLETLAILSPLSDYGHAFDKAFTATVAANGGRVVYSDWYFPRETKDFQRQLEALRQTGFAIAPRPVEAHDAAALDAHADTAADTTLEGEWAFSQPAATPPPVVAAPTDSAGFFIDTIDGVAIIVEDFADARTIAPQLRSHRLTTQLLGNDVWYDPEAIAQMPASEREYMKGCIFVSRRRGSEEELGFSGRYRRHTHQDPGYAALGYDAARMLIGGWRAGHRTRGALRDWLGSLRRFEGGSGRVSFSADRRVNTELTLSTIDAHGQVRALRPDDLPGPVPTEVVDPSPPAEEARDGEGRAP